MPNLIQGTHIGETKKGVEVGKCNKGSDYIWNPCPSCGTPKWSLFRKGIIRHPHCSKCSARFGNIVSSSKRKGTTTANRELNTTSPAIGEVRAGFTIGIKFNYKYIWHLCPICNKPKWAMLRKGKPLYPHCEKCGKGIGGHKHKGKFRANRTLNLTSATLGEIRGGYAAGFRNNRRVIWHACEGCGKQRWVSLKKGDTLQNHKCSSCGKLGTIRKPSLETIRTCSRCHNQFPATIEYFIKSSHSHIGITRICKDCKRKLNNIYMNKRRANGKIRLNISVSRGIESSLKEKKNGRHWETLVGYTLEDLIKHLEKQFKEGMNWDNYGKGGWEIDHISPISLFQFNTTSDLNFRLCWALKNLQPLWHVDNMKKSNKVTKPFQPHLPMTVKEKHLQYLAI